MRSVLAAEYKDSDGLPIVSGTYRESSYYWDNLLGEAGNFSLFAFDSIYNDIHVNGNLACKNWYIGQNYTEPHTSFGNYESHPLVNVVSNSINTTASSVDFGYQTVKHPDNDDGRIWGIGMIDTILIPEAYDVKLIDVQPKFDIYGNPIQGGEPENITNNSAIKDKTYIYSYDSNLIDGALQVRSTSYTGQNVTFGHTTDSYVDFDALKSQYQTLSTQLSKLDNNVYPYYDAYDKNNNAIWLNNYGTNVLNVSAKDFVPIMNINNINYSASNGYQGNQSLVINIDLSGVDRFEFPTNIKYRTLEGGFIKDEEQMAFKGTNIIYNFYNAAPGTTVITHSTVGHIIAPDCDVVANGGSGTIIANNIYAANETHMSFIPKGLTIDLPEIVTVEISKQDIDNSRELAGAELTLTGVDNSNNNIIIKESMVSLGEGASFLENESGNGIRFKSGSTKTTIKGLPDGRYTLKEDAAPAGYGVTTDITFEIRDGKVIASSYVTAANGDNPAVVTMKDAMFKTNVAISKVDTEAGEELLGAKLTLKGIDFSGKEVYFSEGQIEKGESAIILQKDGTTLQFLSGKTATLVKDLPDGKYTLTEDAAPAGYDVTTAITFEIKDGKVVDSSYVTAANGDSPAIVTMKDAMFRTDVAISKVDTEGGEELPGAELILTGKD
ncbi:MAG: choice-of-anchor A family protein, partial [Clostridia bacterium]|nr:choice-of-anchor A family protein [Clostridia bacterium]